jgi:hypothetical protein
MSSRHFAFSVKEIILRSVIVMTKIQCNSKDFIKKDLLLLLLNILREYINYHESANLNPHTKEEIEDERDILFYTCRIFKYICAVAYDEINFKETKELKTLIMSLGGFEVLHRLFLHMNPLEINPSERQEDVTTREDTLCDLALCILWLYKHNSTCPKGFVFIFVYLFICFIYLFIYIFIYLFIYNHTNRTGNVLLVCQSIHNIVISLVL